MTKLELPSAVQHAAVTRDDGEPSLRVDALLSIAIPTVAELGHAVRKGWIAGADAVAIATRKSAVGADLHVSEQRLVAGEIGSEQFAVEAAAIKAPVAALTSYWVYAFMSWGWRVRAQVPKPSRVVEAVFIALDKPYQLEPFAWMARRWGPPVGFLRSRRRAQRLAWRAYLDSESEYYRDRSVLQGVRRAD